MLTANAGTNIRGNTRRGIGSSKTMIYKLKYTDSLCLSNLDAFQMNDVTRKFAAPSSSDSKNRWASRGNGILLGRPVTATWTFCQVYPQWTTGFGEKAAWKRKGYVMGYRTPHVHARALCPLLTSPVVHSSSIQTHIGRYHSPECFFVCLTFFSL